MTTVEAAVRPYVPDLGMPHAAVFDIDGTVALHAHRGPFDFAKCETDEVNEAVVEAMWLYHRAGYRIILVSGRPEDYREETERWLEAHGIPYRELHMRGSGDFRPDNVVKAELFDRHLRDRFNVRVVYDDRDRVVKFWRSIGLPCFQVAEGAF